MSLKISVIVPIYNAEQYLEECLNHIVNQTYDNLEIILVNDGSTDRSEEIIQKYCSNDNRVRYIYKENGGLSSARNAGLDIATGDYVGFVDADDVPDERMYEILMNLINKYSVKVAICSYCRSKEKKIDKKIEEIKMSAADVCYEMAIAGKTEAHAWNKLYKRELFHGIRYPLGRLYEDVFTTYKIIDKVHYIAYTSEKLYYYRDNEFSITNRKYKENDIDLVLASKEYLDYLGRKGYCSAASRQRDSLTRNAIAMARKMFLAGLYQPEQVKLLANVIREGYPKYLASQFSLSSKVFGMGMLVSSRIIYDIYRRVSNVGFHKKHSILYL